MSNVALPERDTFDLKGVGELKARPGTATHELAGMAKYWSDKYKNVETEIVSARRTGFLGGVVFATLTFLVSFAIYHIM